MIFEKTLLNSLWWRAYISCLRLTSNWFNLIFRSAPAIFLPHPCHLWVPVDKIHHCLVGTHETKLYEITFKCQLGIHELRRSKLRTSLINKEWTWKFQNSSLNVETHQFVFFLALFDCLSSSIFSKSRWDKFAKRLFSLVALSLCGSFWRRFRCFCKHFRHVS